jgi:hypothetical protein
LSKDRQTAKRKKNIILSIDFFFEILPKNGYMVVGWVCQEYLGICEEYGVEVTDEDLKNVLAIADEDGEVRQIQI